MLLFRLQYSVVLCLLYQSATPSCVALHSLPLRCLLLQYAALHSTGYDLLLSTFCFKSLALFSDVESAAHQSAALLLVSLLLISQQLFSLLIPTLLLINILLICSSVNC